MLTSKKNYLQKKEREIAKNIQKEYSNQIEELVFFFADDKHER